MSRLAIPFILYIQQQQQQHQHVDPVGDSDKFNSGLRGCHFYIHYDLTLNSRVTRVTRVPHLFFKLPMFIIIAKI